jgi:hypothetical protein
MHLHITSNTSEWNCHWIRKPLYTTFILSAEIVAELVLVQQHIYLRILMEWFYHLQNVNWPPILCSPTPPAVKAILACPVAGSNALVTLVGFVFSSYRPKTTLPVTSPWK